MIIIKPIKPKRQTEMAISCALAGLGLVLIIFDNILSSYTSLRPLLSVVPQVYWAYITLIVGVIRILAISLDGKFSKAPHLRLIGYAGGVMVWGTFFVVSLLNVPERVFGIPIYMALLYLDYLALWRSSGEAKLVDQLARSNREKQ